MLCLVDAPNTAIAPTSISPSVNAKAVAAVRRGLRTAFVRDRRPTEPKGRVIGPRAAMMGRDSAGAPSSTATIVPSAPRPTSEAPEPADFAT